MGMGSTIGPMESSTPANGRKERCMETASLSGLMANSM